MLVPGKQGFDSAKLAHSMREMIERDQCTDVLIIVDTLKKFVDLMDKRSAADFGTLVRQFVLAGGTFFALAHTRKNEGADGKLVYSGTTDVTEDFDGACLLVPLQERGTQGEKLVQFQFFKRRGANADQTFAFDDDLNLSYQERLASVRLMVISCRPTACNLANLPESPSPLRVLRPAFPCGRSGAAPMYWWDRIGRAGI